MRIVYLPKPAAHTYRPEKFPRVGWVPKVRLRRRKWGDDEVVYLMPLDVPKAKPGEG